MFSLTTHIAARKFGALVALARKSPVEITRYNRPVAVVISPAAFRDFERLKREDLRRSLANAAAAIGEAPASEEDKAVRVLAQLIKRANG